MAESHVSAAQYNLLFMIQSEISDAIALLASGNDKLQSIILQTEELARRTEVSLIAIVWETSLCGWLGVNCNYLHFFNQIGFPRDRKGTLRSSS